MRTYGWRLWGGSVQGSLPDGRRSVGIGPSRDRTSRPRGTRYPAAIVSVLLLFISSAAFSAPEQPPNIVFILIDDLGWTDVGCFGSSYYETPNIDRLCREGLKFTSAYTNGPNCAPTRASLMSGQYTPRHGIYTVGSAKRGQEEFRKLEPPENRRRLDADIPTIAERLKAAGYVTASLGKWHLGNPPQAGPQQQGFDINLGGYQRGHPPTYFSPYGNQHLEDGPDGEYLTDRLTDEAVDFIAQNRQKPFFLYLSHFAVHTPIQAQRELIAKYRRKEPAGGHKDPVYAAMVDSVDQSVGRVLAELDQLNLTGRTVVIFTSDNGGLGGYEAAGAYGSRDITSNAPLHGGKGMLYEGGIRVPLIVRWPGIVEPGSSSDEPVITIDFYPTLLEITGAEAAPDHHLDGVSLVPLFSAASPAASGLGPQASGLGRQALFWHFPAYLEADRDRGIWRTTPAGAVRSGDYKLIEFFEEGRVELYNLKEDIGETTDLAHSLPSETARLRKQLQDWRQSVGAQMPVPRFDVVIQDGKIVDGSGNPWYLGDVGIRHGRIAAIGQLDDAAAGRVIDARNLVVAPGFIDVHTHVEGTIARIPSAENFLFDGVTSIVTGNCGGSKTDLAAFFSELRQSGISLNLATLIGHNSVRRSVMGSEQRDPTPQEQAQMEALVAEAMRAGAVGLSTGLIYIPGTYAKTDEIIGLARVASRFGGCYASHMRNEGDQIAAAIAEAVEIGRAAEIPVEVSHFKISNKLFWGNTTETIRMVEEARAAGIDVTVDQYPYAVSSTTLGILLPDWAHAGGGEELQKRLANPGVRHEIALDMKEHLRKRSGRDSLDYAVVARCEWDDSLEGKSIAQITSQKGRANTLDNEIETVLEIMEKGSAQMVYHSMSEEDVERVMRFPYAMVASDGGVVEFGVGLPHPRSYGTNARVLGRFVREKKLLRLEEAIRKMTSLPAQRFALQDRGLVRPGMWADLVIFDENKVIDRAEFGKPHAYSEGFHYVLVNGAPVIDSSVHTNARPGRILLGPGAAIQ
ncbi:MAG: sulfatase-like hydrolase/transferase [Acidobacteriota bacterium]